MLVQNGWVKKGKKDFVRNSLALPSYQILYSHPKPTLPPELSSIFFCFLKYQEGSKALDTYNTTKVNFVPWGGVG